MKIWKIHGTVAFHDRPGGPPGNTLALVIEGECIPFGTIVPVVEKSLYDACVKSHDDNVTLLKEFQKLLSDAKVEIERLEKLERGK